MSRQDIAEAVLVLAFSAFVLAALAAMFTHPIS